MAPVEAGGGQLTSGPLEVAVTRDFGSFDDFKKIFNTTTAAIQGSGWGWVVRFFFLLGFFMISQKTYIYELGV